MLHTLSEKADFDGGSMGPRRRTYFRQIAFLGVLLCIILWGSTSLITSVAYLRQTTATDKLNFLLQQNSPDLLQKFRANKNSKSHQVDKNGKKPLDFDAVRSAKFRPNHQQLQWIKEPNSILNDKGTYVLKSENEFHNATQYVIKSIEDDSYQYNLFNDTSFVYGNVEYSIDQLVASPDLSKAILKTNSTHNWRHSTFALYWVLDVSANTITPLRDTKEKIATTSWSPSSTNIAYIYENNVYIKDIHTSKTEQVTFDGGAELFYGKPDWVYEEEVFGTDIALWWSPTGDKVAFLKTNDTFVPEYVLPYFVQDESKYQDYPEIRKIKYPKAGYPNPIVDLIIYDLKTTAQSSSEMNVSDFKASSVQDRLITEVVWVSEEYLLVKTSNRASDILDIFLIEAKTNDAQLIRSHTAENSWFEITSNTIYVPKNETQGRREDGYIDTIVIDGYNHLAYFSPPQNPNGIILTQGQWEVIEGVSSLDYVNNEVYFIGTKKSSIERHIYSVNLAEAASSTSETIIRNVTDVSQEGWYSGSFSSGSRYLLLDYQGPSTPYQKLIDLHNLSDASSSTIIEENKQLIENLEGYNIPETNYQVITLATDEETGEEIKANAMETLPLNFDPSKKYPVLFFVYGGPGSQMVSTTFGVGFSEVVAAELDAVVVTVDGRGTGFNNLNEKLGADFKFCVRDQLGYYEPRDQISAAKNWSKRDYVDSNRIAIWGWSYGGFLTLKTLETDSEEHVFSYGMSVAPVTKWKLYDSIYTERYMRTPQENPKGYETASIHDLSNFHNVTRFMIAHGSGDDNVHFQNSLKLIDEFNLATIENFDFYIFPDSDHSITYHNGGVVVYDRLLTWLKRAFEGEYI
ncbi:dipeptidyl aminopeptidase A [[Candida] anglica]|uniref:Dipeptidyl aminopeptidase A n=1 Tax=[Candida] anglica TaxID=148631 RepID=A0ABP0EJK1_9ASCO